MRHEASSGYEDATLNYLVTWTIMDGGGKTDEMVFTSRDAGWDYCQMLKSSSAAYNVSREHIPAQ